MRAFTLVELLVVIGLLSMLFVALLPLVTGAEDRNREAQCKVLVGGAHLAAKGYMAQRRFQDWPPDDFRDTSSRLKEQPTNGYNTGIESFLLFINREDSSSPRFPERDEHLGNTDGDKGRSRIAKLDRLERVELIDPWGNPIAYFHFRNYGIEQNYRMGGEMDDEQPASAWKDGTRWINARSCQIFSAGPDGVFNTEDDIGNFDIPEQR